MAFKPIDGKRDEFRKYLERTGVLEAISKVFVKLVNCPERPENAIEFIRENLGDTLHQSDAIEHLKQELEDARSEIAQLKRTIENLKVEKVKPVNVLETEENIIPSSTDETINATVNKTNPSEVQEEPPIVANEQKEESINVSVESNNQETEAQTQTQNTSSTDDSNKPVESN